jgi:V8-like Glu-specific endopeptidase
MRSPRSLLGALAALVLGLTALVVGAGTATTASGATGSGGSLPAGVEVHRAATTKAAQDRVTAYWTAKRMREALPPTAPSTVTASSSGVERGAPYTVAARAKPGGGTPTYPAAVVATTGKVFFTEGGVNYVCSGTATASTNGSVVTTAGHCVNEGPGAYVTNFAFVPAYDNGARPYGTWTARTLVTTTQWAGSGDFTYDAGFAVMNTVAGRTLTATVGGQGISFNLALGLAYNAYGYPAAGKFNGQTLRSCSGTATPDPYGQTQSQGIPCDMTGGSSGGPWLTSNNTVLNSVNSFGYQGLRNVMFGPYFGSQIESAYSTASTR